MQHNGVVQPKRTVAALRIDAEGLTVSAGDKVIAAARYHADMQVQTQAKAPPIVTTAGWCVAGVLYHADMQVRSRERQLHEQQTEV